jgi:hypothetical protein
MADRGEKRRRRDLEERRVPAGKLHCPSYSIMVGGEKAGAVGVLARVASAATMAWGDDDGAA